MMIWETNSSNTPDFIFVGTQMNKAFFLYVT